MKSVSKIFYKYVLKMGIFWHKPLQIELSIFEKMLGTLLHFFRLLYMKNDKKENEKKKH